jgi:hypothetical protein
MEANTEAIPQAALAKVNETARWNPRIMEKCRGWCAGSFMAKESTPWSF